MPTLPTISPKSDNVTMVSTFLGINKGMHISESEFDDMQNMTNDYFPIIANRKRRAKVGDVTKPQGILGGQYLAYISNNQLYYNDTLVNTVTLSQSDKERQLVQIGAYLCIFPDHVIYNTNDGSVKTMENETTTTGTVTMRMCKLDGTEFSSSNTHIGTTAPSDKTTYPYWMDTSGSTVILKMWSATYSMWTSVATTYVKISSTGIGKGFIAYDAVKFSGIKTKGYNDYDFNNTLIVYAAGDDYLIVAGLMDLLYTQTSAVTCKRDVPEMDFVCELDNRIWGCSSDNHEIYACKQGDPTNWNFYAGLDNDSYAATIGTQGRFTGATSYGGYVYFFKEDGFHKLYGTKPSNYEMVWKPCRGVQEGCSKSLAIVDEILFYKSRDAICAYDGSVDTISEKLGIEPYYDAVGAGYRNKYYVSMRDVDYHWKVYVYDVTKGTWCIEDNTRINFSCYANNATYFINDNNELWVINNEKIYAKYWPNQTELGDQFLYPFPASGYGDYTALYAGDIVEGNLEQDLEWMIETGDLGLDNPYNKYIKRINLRMELDSSSSMRIEIEYDSSGTWEYVCDYYCNRRKSYEIPISVRRADHVRLRLSGHGDIKVFSIAKAVEAGSGETNGNSN